MSFKQEMIFAIPGFLGLPSDWELFPTFFPVDLYAFSWRSLFDWAKDFNQFVKERSKRPRTLMGYSLGGRLALHALLDQKDLWDAAILISAHIGLDSQEEILKREESDERWARRFEKEEWNPLMKEWNAQPIFQRGHFHFDRQEKNYKRNQLANILMQGSLARQKNLQEEIAKLPIPLLWITGELDFPYCQMAQKLTFSHPLSCFKMIANAGHRVPWDQPRLFLKLVQDFVS